MQIAPINIKKEFEMLYDTYSAMLYGIAVEISSSRKDADEILIITFEKAQQQSIGKKKYPSPSILLIKLLIQTAHQQFNNNTGNTILKIKQFKNYPILHSILSDQGNTESDFGKNNNNGKRTGEKLRAEFLLMRYVNSQQKLPLNNKNGVASFF